MNQAAVNKPFFLLKTLFITYLLTGILLLTLAFILYKLRLSNTQVQTGVYLIYILSCFLGGFLAGKKMKSRRFLWGMLMGGLYFVVLFLVSSLAGRPLESGFSYLLLVLGICLAGGTSGGMLS
ncbi:MAG: TIGR04086 family membrane protein [Lachnospiraceae bacterium]|nr:TIGR04086 family membrane protein [Lachnospiraceae bacterium]